MKRSLLVWSLLPLTVYWGIDVSGGLFGIPPTGLFMVLSFALAILWTVFATTAPLARVLVCLGATIAYAAVLFVAKRVFLEPRDPAAFSFLLGMNVFLVSLWPAGVFVGWAGAKARRSMTAARDDAAQSLRAASSSSVETLSDSAASTSSATARFGRPLLRGFLAVFAALWPVEANFGIPLPPLTGVVTVVGLALPFLWAANVMTGALKLVLICLPIAVIWATALFLIQQVVLNPPDAMSFRSLLPMYVFFVSLWPIGALGGWIAAKAIKRMPRAP